MASLREHDQSSLPTRVSIFYAQQSCCPSVCHLSTPSPSKAPRYARPLPSPPLPPPSPPPTHLIHPPHFPPLTFSNSTLPRTSALASLSSPYPRFPRPPFPPSQESRKRSNPLQHPTEILTRVIVVPALLPQMRRAHPAGLLGEFLVLRWPVCWSGGSWLAGWVGRRRGGGGAGALC